MLKLSHLTVNTSKLASEPFDMILTVPILPGMTGCFLVLKPQKWNQPLFRALVYFNGKVYFKATIWVLRMLAATGLATVSKSFQSTELENNKNNPRVPNDI